MISPIYLRVDRLTGVQYGEMLDTAGATSSMQYICIRDFGTARPHPILPLEGLDMKSQSHHDHLLKDSDVGPIEGLIAGSISGGVARAITAPLDTLKIRLQLQGPSERLGTFNIVKGILRREGISGFWKGNVPAEILYILYGAVQFSSFAVLNKALQGLENDHNIKVPSYLHTLFAGLGSGVASTSITYPFDYLRTRLAANTEKEMLSMAKTMSHVVKSEGWRGLYAGFQPTMLSVASATGIMFWSYELARSATKDYDSPFLDMMCGFVAGGTSKGLTFPLDTLRKRAQMYSSTHAGKSALPPYKLFQSIIRHEGPLALYRGFGMSLLKTAPTSAIALTTYEYVLDFERDYRASHKLMPN